MSKGEYEQQCNVEACQEPPAVFWNRSTRAWYCERCAHKINRANDEKLCFKVIGHQNRRAIAVWREDDAPVPDKESLADAYQRIYGRRWDADERATAIDTEDLGEGVEYVMPNGGPIVWSSYPGASAIFELTT